MRFGVVCTCKELGQPHGLVSVCSLSAGVDQAADIAACALIHCQGVIPSLLDRYLTSVGQVRSGKVWEYKSLGVSLSGAVYIS